MRPLNFSNDKDFDRWDAFVSDLALYQNDIPSVTQETFWLQINKLIEQDKIYIHNNTWNLNYNNINNPYN